MAKVCALLSWLPMFPPREDEIVIVRVPILHGVINVQSTEFQWDIRLNNLAFKTLVFTLTFTSFILLRYICI